MRYSIVVWRVHSGEVTADQGVHTRWVGGAAFTRDGRRLLTASADQCIRIWNATTWKTEVMLQGHLNEIWCIAMSPDGQTFATGDKNGELKIWDLTRHGSDRRPILVQDRIDRFVPSVDRLAFATRQLDGSAFQFWDSRTLHPLPVPTLPNGEIRCFSVQTRLAVIGSDRVRLVHLEDGTARELPGRLAAIRGDLALSEDGRYLVIAAGREVRVLDLPDGATVASLTEDGMFQPLAISPLGRYVLLGVIQSNRDLVVWDIRSNTRHSVSLAGPMPNLTRAAFSPDQKHCAIIGPHGVLHLFALEENGPRLQTQVDPNLLALNSLAFSPDGRTLVVAGGSDRLWFIDGPSLQESGTLEGYTAFTLNDKDDVTFSSDGANLIIGDSKRASVYALRAPTLAEIDAFEKAQANARAAARP